MVELHVLLFAALFLSSRSRFTPTAPPAIRLTLLPLHLEYLIYKDCSEQHNMWPCIDNKTLILRKRKQKNTRNNSF